MSVVSARMFNQSPSKVKAMAADGPVFVTDRGRPTLVVLTIDDYDRLTGSGSIRDSLRMDVTFETDRDIEFDPRPARDLGRVADL